MSWNVVGKWLSNVACQSMGGEHSFVTCLLSKWAQQHGNTVKGVSYELLFAINQ